MLLLSSKVRTPAQPSVFAHFNEEIPVKDHRCTSKTLGGVRLLVTFSCLFLGFLWNSVAIVTMFPYLWPSFHNSVQIATEFHKKAKKRHEKVTKSQTPPRVFEVHRWSFHRSFLVEMGKNWWLGCFLGPQGKFFFLIMVAITTKFP